MTRLQKVPMLSNETAADFDTILIATGSEVNLAVSAAKELAVKAQKSA